jgi:hypothetical protein
VDWRDVAYSFAEECVSEIILRHAWMVPRATTATGFL